MEGREHSMRVHHCPRCDLRFLDEPDLRDHLVTDHGVEPKYLEHHLAGWHEEMERHRTEPDLVHPGDQPG